MNIKTHEFVPLVTADRQNANSVLICDKCWNMVKVTDIIPRREFEVSSTYNNFTINSIKLDFEVYCEHCNNFLFQCDEEFVSRIIKLNELGVETCYCCEGHVTETLFGSRGDKYILIDMPYLAIDKSISITFIVAIKNILSQQRYQFIKLEDDSDDMYVLRGSLYDQSSIIEQITDEDDRSGMKENFNAMKSRYFDFIDEFINTIESIIDSYLV